MKKIFFVLIAGLFFAIAGNCEAARYFLQGDKPGSSTPYGNNLSAGNYVKAGDAKIYYEIYGEGKPILILHGGGVGSPYELGKIIDELKENYKAVVASTRGHGRSEIGHSPLTYEQKAEDMKAVIEKISSEPIQIVGFSDGAYTAYKIAAMYPEKVERIVAIGAGTLESGYFSGELKLNDLEKIDPAFVEYEKTIRPEPKRTQEFYDEYMKFWNKMSVGEEIFGKIKCPVLLIVGDEDDHAPVITVLAAHQMLENSRLCVIPKAWHTAFSDNYEVFEPAIMQFVNAPVESLIPSKKVEYNSKFGNSEIKN